MSDAHSQASAIHPGSLEAAPEQPGRGKRRRGRRVLIWASAAGTLVLVVGTAGTYVAASHLADNVQRIPGVFNLVDHASRPPVGKAGSMTVLVTSDQMEPAIRGGKGEDHASTTPQQRSGLIALVHLNAGGTAGAVVSLPPDAVVSVPHHGKMELEDTLALGGPALLLETVEGISHVRIDDYSVVDFPHLDADIDALGGVEVAVREKTTSDGYTFTPGVDPLTSASAMAYVRQASITEDNRVQRQQSVIRAVLDKLASENPVTHYSAYSDFTKALSVDSSLSTFRLVSLTRHLGSLTGSHATLVTVPARQGPTGKTLDPALSSQLWQAIRTDSVAAFAKRHPRTVTPVAPF